jgi:hypothetical protein
MTHDFATNPADDWWNAMFQEDAPDAVGCDPVAVPDIDPVSTALTLDEVVIIGDAGAAILNVIARFFGGVRHVLTMHEVARLLAADLCVMPHVGPIRAERVRQAVIDRLGNRVPAEYAADEFVPAEPVPTIAEDCAMIDAALADEIQHIWTEGLLPAAAADHLGVSVDEVRARLEARGAAGDEVAVRILKVWAWAELVEQGLSLRAIGEQAGISGERVRQLLRRFGVNTRAVGARRRQRHVEDRRARIRSVEQLVRSYPGITAAEACHLLELDADGFADLGHGVRHLVLRPADHDEITRLADRRATLIDSLRQAAAIQSPLTGDVYEQLVADGVVPGPGKQTAFIVFGSWVAACEAAGVTSGDTLRPAYERRWTDAEIDLAVIEYLTDPFLPGTADGYEEWAALHDAPSAALVRMRSFGSWKEATRRALLTARQLWANSGDADDFGDWLLAS